jgi:diphthine synthase
VILADREMVESSSDAILEGANTADVAFLVVGDPFGYVVLERANLRGQRLIVWQSNDTYRSRAPSS